MAVFTFTLYFGLISLAILHEGRQRKTERALRTRGIELPRPLRVPV